jgi:hypothetical protein
MKKYHYVYRITNILNSKHYYGVRSCNCSPREDIGIKYFSSSTDKEFINDQIKNSANYKYKIIRIFKLREDALILEVKLHKKFDVASNELFYNRAIQTSKFFDTTGTKHTKETIDKLSGKIPWNKGIEFSEEHKKNISIAGKGRKHTKEAKKKISKFMKGREPWNKGRILSNIIGYECSKSATAKKINIYNEKDELMFECNGNFTNICIENNLPLSSLRKSYQDNNIKLFESKKGYSKKFIEKHKQFTSWYAKFIFTNKI